MVLVSTAIALGATAMADIAVLDQLAPVLGPAPSDSTVRRVLDLASDPVLARIAQARARIRKHAWALIAATGRGFPWIAVAGRTLQGWLVLDMDATLVTAYPDKENARPTWKKGHGFHPLAAWCINTRECPDMLLRPGNAGPDTFEDHKEVLAAALKQVRPRSAAGSWSGSTAPALATSSSSSCWTSRPGSSACMTRKNSATPPRVRSATASGASPPASSATPGNGS